MISVLLVCLNFCLLQSVWARMGKCSMQEHRPGAPSFQPLPVGGFADPTLMAESEEELKSLLMKVKGESEKVG